MSSNNTYITQKQSILQTKFGIGDHFTPTSRSSNLGFPYPLEGKNGFNRGYVAKVNITLGIDLINIGFLTFVKFQRLF